MLRDSVLEWRQVPVDGLQTKKKILEFTSELNCEGFLDRKKKERRLRKTDRKKEKKGFEKDLQERDSKKKGHEGSKENK